MFVARIDTDPEQLNGAPRDSKTAADPALFYIKPYKAGKEMIEKKLTCRYIRNLVKWKTITACRFFTILNL